MTPEQRQALEAISLNWTRDLKEVWKHCDYHIEGLHPQAARLIRQGIREAGANGESSPLGIALRGEGGVGKTHLLGWTREQVQQAGGYFFLVSDPPQSMFADQVLDTVVQQLRSAPSDRPRPLEILLADLVARAAPEPAVRDAITGQRAPTPEDVTTFITAFRERVLPNLSIAGLDTARALVLLASPELDHQDTGARFFSPVPEDDLGSAERRNWSISPGPHPPKALIEELSRIIAVSGPTVLAVDQIDAIIQEASTAASPDSGRQLLSDVANGLMTLRDLTRRTLIVISCLPDNWERLYKNGVRTAVDRFRESPPLQNIPDAAVGRTLIEKRFAQGFASARYDPPYPSWPIRPDAFEDATGYTARELLRRVDAHISQCLDAHEVRELARLDGEPLTATSGTVRDIAKPAAGPDLTDLDARFSELRARADVAGAFVPATEDAQLTVLLAAGLEAWVREREENGASVFSQDPVPARNPALHACLRMAADDEPGRQRSWAFRAVASDNPKAVQARLRKAVEKAGLVAGNGDRHLFILRTPPWPSGQVTDREVADFAARGGVSLVMTADDLQTFAALRDLLAERPARLDDWLTTRRPAHGTELLARALRDAGQVSGEPASSGPSPTERPSAGQPQQEDRPRPPGDRPEIQVGSAMIGGAPVVLDPESLCKHVSVFAGAGSGKTVLLRRIVEEAALLGVSSIVIDRQNDLARLGTPWPSPPPEWNGADPDRAQEYLAGTDVVVWTPGRNAGRPLSFQPLPAFSDILSDPDKRRADDEFRAAVDTTVETLAPLVRADKATVKADAERAVLREALTHFGRSGGEGLNEFIALLSDLPDEASSVQKATTIGADLASALGNARVNDPLLSSAGEPTDPGMLLRPPPSKRARVSVISLVGLPDLKQQQSFVNQLQLALFSWVRKHPSQSLAWLFAMDEARDFVPSDSNPPSRQATIQLASQVRKYGLGMLFATQHPNAVHNSVTNNSATQFFGRLGSRAAIETVTNLARARGGDLPGIGRMKKGQFYIGTEGNGFRKIRTSMCLSHHPPGPLTEDEVIQLSRGTS